MSPEPQRAAGSGNQLRTVAVIVYTTLGLLLLIMPEEIGSRLDDFTPSPVVRLAQAGVGAIAVVSRTLGLSTAFHAARSGLLALAGLDRA